MQILVGPLHAFHPINVWNYMLLAKKKKEKKKKEKKMMVKFRFLYFKWIYIYLCKLAKPLFDIRK